MIKAIPNRLYLAYGLAETLTHYFGTGSSFAEYLSYGFDEGTISLYQNANDRYLEAHYGFYSLTLSQGEKVLSFTYIISGLGVILSDIGGLGTSIFGIFIFVLSSYQEFAYEKSIFKKLFTIDALDHAISTEDSPRS